MTNEEAIIDLSVLAERMDSKNAEIPVYDISLEAVDMAIKALEQEPKTGHWIVHPKGVYAHLVCDRCLTRAPYDCKTNYCPTCGIKMVEPQESEVSDADSN